MPLKKIGFKVFDSGHELSKVKQCLFDLFNPYWKFRCYKFLSTSSFFSKILKEAWDLEDDQLLEVGQPRCDVFFTKYEDDYILIVNKPHKILVHPDGNTSKTLMNAVHNYLSKKVENTFAYPVHRIDFDTTGIVVFAKDPLTLSFLSTEIENHNLIKKYVCLCYNRFPSLSGKIEKNISKDRHSKKQIISKNGKEAISYYKVLENGSVSKVEVTIIHGRTHQIRVHMQSINHPLLGDKIYGKDDGYDLKLHFKNISFFHPFKGEKIFIECEEQF